MVRRSLNPLRELVFLLWLVRLFWRERPALVHGFTIKCAIYGALAAKLTDVRACVVALAGLGYLFTADTVRARLLRPVVRGLMSLAFRGPGTRLILQNPDDVELIKQANILEGNAVRLIPGSGVDCSQFAANARQRDQEQPFRVLLVARLLWDKGIREFLEAAYVLRQEGRDIQFVMAGAPDTGNPACVPQTQIEAWGREGVVRLLGNVDDMPALLAGVDLVVLPSYREGFPRSLIEAAASGLPLITTDVPGCRDVVIDGVDGLMIPSHDGAALARAIARLHDDPALALRLGQAARLKALAQFDERIVIARTMAVYQEVMEPASTPKAEDAEVLLTGKRVREMS